MATKTKHTPHMMRTHQLKPTSLYNTLNFETIPIWLHEAETHRLSLKNEKKHIEENKTNLFVIIMTFISVCQNLVLSYIIMVAWTSPTKRLTLIVGNFEGNLEFVIMIVLIVSYFIWLVILIRSRLGVTIKQSVIDMVIYTFLFIITTLAVVEFLGLIIPF